MSQAFARRERVGSKPLVSKEFAVRISRPVFGLMLLAFTAGHAALAGEDKGKPAEPPKEEKRGSPRQQDAWGVASKERQRENL